MGEALGRLIRERRAAVGLDQRGLAAALCVGQQAVSGWERGRSRPRRSTLGRLAQILAVDEETLLDAGAYRPPPLTVAVPARPLTRALPFEELNEERFEDLIADLMARLRPEGHVSRFGGRGHKQDGIDILVTAGGMNTATGQCKRHREFGPSAVRIAIEKVAIVAPSNYLFLSRLTATPGARKEASKYANWELWDGEDISRYIRSLPLDQAVRLVDTYFPGHREAFLGVPAPGPWLLPEEYFAPTQSAIFNHEWILAGRHEQVDQLSGPAYQTDATLALLVGVGGIGKTRLLKALVDAAPGAAQVRILPGGVLVSAADFELLPLEGELTVIVDDAHELSDVARVVAGVWRRNQNAKIILATRPYGLQALKDSLARQGLLPALHVEVELGDLDSDAATALAREALGGRVPETVVRRLASLTTDSPLATVVGGVLIKQGQLEPGALEQDGNVRSHIMSGFRDALVNDPLAPDPTLRLAVLDALAAVQPFRTNEVTARESLSAIVGRPYDELHKHLRSLEGAGILRRRGASLRIVPDLLGDVILTEAVFDETNPLGTGYLARIEPLVAGSSTEHLFINVSRVDWQVSNSHDGVTGLADSLWAAFQSRIESADIIDRRALAETLAKVSYFQPQRALQVTRWLIDHPTDHLDPEHVMWRAFLALDESVVLQALPPAIKLSAMTPDTLSEALNQLWELAQRDQRSTDQHPEHALRVLCELSEFGVAKPIWFNDRIVDIASTWFVDCQRISPFEVLVPMLATEGEDSRLRGHTITFRPFSLDPQSIMRVRQRVIDLAFHEFSSSDLRRAGAAARFLDVALRYPIGLFGRPVSAEERDAWTPGFVQTIRRLGTAGASGELDPALLVSIREVLHWHENYGPEPTRDAAVTAVASLPSGIEPLLALAVHDGWGRLARDRGDNFEAMEAKRLEVIQAVVTGLTGLTDRKVVDLLVARVRADREVHEVIQGEPGPVIVGLIEARPTLARAMLRAVRSTHGSHDLDPVLPVILAAHAEHDAEAALEDVKAFLTIGSEDRRRSASQAIAWNRGHRELHPGELDLLLQLAADPDVVIRRNIARAAQLLARTQTAEATRLLAALRFGDDEGLANNIFDSFRTDLGISWDNFSEAELALIRQDLLTVPGIGGYSVSEALAARSATDPGWVIELLQDRVGRSESLDSIRKYDALPYIWHHPLQVRGTPEFLPRLRGILLWITEGVDRARWTLGARLFAAVANGYDTQVVGILASALASGAEQMTLAVIAVLHDSPRTFIWDQSDFVCAALHAADRQGRDMLQEMMRALWAAAISGVRSGTPGQPFPESVEQRDKSRDIAKNLPTGSVEERFYTDMAKGADRDILRDAESDLPADGRDW